MLVGFYCPSHGEEPGRQNEISYCLNECSNPCVAPNVLAALLDDPDWKPRNEDYRISVTMLTGGCKRKTLLERTLPYYALPNDRLALFRGKLIHGVVEDSTEALHSFTKGEDGSSRFFIEEKMELPVTTQSGTWTLVGKLDMADLIRGTIYDHKTLQEYAIMKMVTGANSGTWSPYYSDQYVLQTNIYRYMAKHRWPNIEFNRLRLQIIGFGQLVTTGTTNHEVKIRKGYKNTNDAYDIPDIPLLDDDIITGIIEREGEEWFKILYAGAQAPVRDTDWQWLCKYCQFFGGKHCPDPDKEAGTSVMVEND